MDKWRCRICGYDHEGKEPPEACPWCGAPKPEFVLLECAWDGTCGDGPADRNELLLTPEKAQVQGTNAAGNRENIFAALGLEYGSYSRYQTQLEALNNPRINSVLGGLKRSHRNNAAVLINALKRSLPPAREGFAEILLQLELNLKLAEGAQKTFRGFQAEALDEDVKELFDNMARAEAVHAALLRSIQAEIMSGTFPVVFYCPACGVELDFGAGAKQGMVRQCPECGEEYELYLTEGDFKLRRIRQNLPG